MSKEGVRKFSQHHSSEKLRVSLDEAEYGRVGLPSGISAVVDTVEGIVKLRMLQA